MYSQSEEEKFILEYAGEEGTVLDIGAYDGKTFSNSLALIEKGFYGVLVEPSTGPFRALQALHKGNPRVQLVNALVGGFNGIVQFWSSEDGVSTTELAHYDKWEGHADFYPPHFQAQVTLHDIFFWMALASHNNPEVVTIDTEGTSSSLFSQLLQMDKTPKVICVEFDKYDTQIVEAAEQHRYDLVYRSAENLVFKRGY